MKWIVDIVGDSGKSIFVDLLERKPELKVLRLTLDYYRSFKYQSAKDVSEYQKKNGPPDVILIDAPRDEETRFLHEIYAALEEMNNGRLEGQFQGKKIKDSMPRNIPIIVFSNSPPIIGALSDDRWDTMALYEYDDEEKRDIYIQKAIVSCNIKDVTGNLIYWSNYIQTKVDDEIGDEYASQRSLSEMQLKNIKLTERRMRIEESITNQHSKLKPGQISKESHMNVATQAKAPSYVLIKAKEKLKNFYRKKVDDNS